MTITSINKSIGVKNFLKSFYKHEFYVEKDRRKEGEKIFLFSKENTLPKKLMEDIYLFKGKIKINGNKAGALLDEWKKFIKYLSEGKKTQGKIESELAKEISSKVEFKDKSILISALKEEINSSAEEGAAKDYNDQTKEEFTNHPPDEVKVKDFNGIERNYLLDEDKKGYTVFENEKPIISVTVESIHEKLLCQAYKEGKQLNLDLVNQDYPYFSKKCNPETSNENASLKNGEEQFVSTLHQNFAESKRLNKRDLEKIASTNGITLITKVFELAEYAWIKWYRTIALKESSVQDAYQKIVDFYNNVQPIYSLKDSVRVEFQQYSTAAPISYLAQVFCNVNEAELVFEPSAGNGLLVFASPYEKTIVNELDKERLSNLKKEPFLEVLNQDAELPFQDITRKADAVLTNPPFGRLSSKIKVDGYNIKALDHAMVTIALDTLKDSGRAAIIIGGHTTFYEDGMIRSFRTFFNWLFHFYNVSDIININGDLYAKQGTQVDIRLILVDGRKENPEGFAPLIKSMEHPLRVPVNNFEQLYERVNKSIQNTEWIFPKLIEKTTLDREMRIGEKSFFDIPLSEITLYEYGISTPLNTYEVKKVAEVDLEAEDYYLLAHKANHNGELYYVMSWKLHYEVVSKALQDGKKVAYPIIKDYPNLLRQYKDRYKIEETESIPLNYNEWIINGVVISKGFIDVTIYSTINGEVFFSTGRRQWDKNYEYDEKATERVMKEAYRKYISKHSSVPLINLPEYPGQLILIKNQLQIALSQ